MFTISMLGALALKHFVPRVPVAVRVRAMSSAVQRMSVTTFDRVLKSPDRSKYQIVDVREKLELAEAWIPGKDIINLPLSNADEWCGEVIDGKILDPKKPTLCLCHHGMRSMQVASFLGKLRTIS